jgi:hypothetical protein
MTYAMLDFIAHCLLAVGLMVNATALLYHEKKGHPQKPSRRKP